MSPRTFRIAAVLILVLSAAFRLALILAMPNQPTSDVGFYDEAARTLLGTGTLVYPNGARAWFPPAWPIVLAAFHLVLGPGAWVVKAVNLVLSVLTVHLVIRLGARVLGDRAGLVAGALVGLMPGTALYVLLAQYEVFLTATVAAILLVLSRIDARPTRGTVLALGTLLAVMVMTRPPFLGLALLVAVLLHRRGASLRSAGLVLLPLLAALALWTARNAVVLRAFVPFDTHSGYNAWIATRPEADGGPGLVPPSADPDVSLYALGDEVRIDRRGWALARARVLADPFAFVRLVPRRLLALYGTDTTGLYLAFLRPPMDHAGPLERWRTTDLPEKIVFRSYALVMVLALVGALRVDWHQHGVRLWAGFVLYVTAFAALSFGTDRFHVPLMPVFCLFAAAAVTPRRLVPYDA